MFANLPVTCSVTFLALPAPWGRPYCIQHAHESAQILSQSLGTGWYTPCGLWQLLLDGYCPYCPRWLFGLCQTRTCPVQPGDENVGGGLAPCVCARMAVILRSGMFALTIPSNCSHSGLSPLPLLPQIKQHLWGERLFFIRLTLPFF